MYFKHLPNFMSFSLRPWSELLSPTTLHFLPLLSRLPLFCHDVFTRMFFVHSQTSTPSLFMRSSWEPPLDKISPDLITRISTFCQLTQPMFHWWKCSFSNLLPSQWAALHYLKHNPSLIVFKIKIWTLSSLNVLTTFLEHYMNIFSLIPTISLLNTQQTVSFKVLDDFSAISLLLIPFLSLGNGPSSSALCKFLTPLGISTYLLKSTKPCGLHNPWFPSVVVYYMA